MNLAQSQIVFYMYQQSMVPDHGTVQAATGLPSGLRLPASYLNWLIKIANDLSENKSLP